MKNITVIGTGYVGLVSGAGMSDFGNNVCCVDIDKEKIKLMSEEPRLIKRPIIVFDGVIFAGINENSLREELSKKNLFS